MQKTQNPNFLIAADKKKTGKEAALHEYKQFDLANTK